jgi:hypothetical protein
MGEAANLAETREIVTRVLRELRGPVRRTRVDQKLRRWTGRASFRLGRHATRPSEVHLAGLGITPLWETDREGPDDLDLLRPTIVTRRFTLGHTWTLTHDAADFHAVVVLVVADSRLPWLLLPNHARFPANAYGWRKAMTMMSWEFSALRGHSLG